MSTEPQSNGDSQQPGRLRLPPRLAQSVERWRAWLIERRGRALGVAGAMLGLALVAGVVLLGQARRVIKQVEQEEKVTLEMALDSLERGFYAQAREMIAKLRRQPIAADEKWGPPFVLGAMAVHDAGELLDEDQRNYYFIAARYLEEARSAGVPAAYQAEALFLLGKSLCLAGKTVEGRVILEDAIEGDTQQSAEAHRILAKVYSEGTTRDLAKALEHINSYIDSPNLAASDQHDGLMVLSQMYWDLGDAAACRAALDRIPTETVVAPDAALLRGRLLLEEARKLKALWKAEPTEAHREPCTKKYDEAIEAFRRGQDDPLRTVTHRQSLYLVGVCYLEMENYPAAVNQFERTRKVYLDAPEGIAAALQEADLLRVELEQQDDAVEAYHRALGAVPDGPEFVNAWIPAEEFRARVLEAYRHYMEGGDFDRAVEIAEHLSPLFTLSRQVQVLAEIYRTQAVKVLADAGRMRESDAVEAVRRGRTLWRKTGRMFEELAQLNFTTREYPDDLWQAAEAHLQGHDFKRAAAAFENYLKYELRRRRPRALVGLAEARLALNDLDGTLSACQECIEFYANDAASYHARLLAAEANLEKGELTAAEDLLRQNLTSDLLTPESREWRDSLFTLGKVLHADRRFDEAIVRLQEAVSRYPDTSQAIEARYLIAEGFREAAKVPQEKLETDAIETARVAHQKQKTQYLSGAIENYELVQAGLNQRQDQRELTPLEKSILRNSYFAMGSAQFDLGRYEDAIQTYSAASNRYQHDPEVLEAFVQMASCHRRLNRPLEARGTLQQAKVVLDRLPQDAPFTTATNASRREWAELLEWLNNL